MIRNKLPRIFFQFPIKTISNIRNNSSKELNVEELGTEVTNEVVEDLELKEEELQQKRNKSRLREADRRYLFEENPFDEPLHWVHGTLKYNRRTYGRYGASSGVDPSICWPIKQELEDIKEYERVKYPLTVSELIQEAKRNKAEKHRQTMERQQEIVENVKKLDQWKRELQEKIAKRENEVLEAKMRRERLIEEVKRHFNYQVDPKDERFTEMLAKKEKEQRKMMKEARKKAREEKLALKKQHDATENTKKAPPILE